MSDRAGFLRPFWNRSAGTVASAFVIACSTPSGALSRSVRTCGTGSKTRLAKMAWGVGASVGRLARQHFVEHAAECVDIRASIHCRAAGLLRGHIGRGTYGHPRLGELRPSSVLEPLGHAEVRDQRVAVGEEDVLRLQIAVHHALAVRVVEGDATWRAMSTAVRPAAALPGEAAREGLALARRASCTRAPGGLAGVQHGRMWGCCKPAPESISRRNRSGPRSGGKLWVHHLERDGAIVLQVVGEVDRGHAAATELALDL